MKQSCRDIALHYFVDDLPSATIIGGRLQKIVDCIYLGKSVSDLSVRFLRQFGLEALHRLATGALHYNKFRELAVLEQACRIEAATAAKLASDTGKRAREAVSEAQERAREVAMWAKIRSARSQADAARLARESDPKNIRKVKNQQLRTRYNICTFVEKDCFDQLMSILESVDAGQRLGEETFVWLSSVGKPYFSDQLRTAYHRLEAKFFVDEFQRTGDPWMAVNASKHFRKCSLAKDADALLSPINIAGQKSPKLKAALCTTHGGAMRDLGNWDEALRLGETAYAIEPADYRPCTLLGAIHMETGNYGLGQEWYAKAVERGATVDSVDQDLRTIFFRADQAKQEKMREFLLSDDPVRFAWVRKGPRQPKSKQEKGSGQARIHAAETPSGSSFCR